MSGPRRRITKAEFLAAYAKHRRNVKSLCEELRCSRATIYRWLARFAPPSEEEVAPASPDDWRKYVPKPDPDWIEREVDREIEDVSDTGMPVCLIGETGTGKTMSAKEIAAGYDLPFLRVPCDSSVDFNELLGSFHLVKGCTVWREGQLVTFIQRPSAVLLDEINALAPGVFFVLFQLLDSGTIFVKEANKTFIKHPDARLFLAANPPTSSYSVSPVSAALMNRVMPIEVPPFTDGEVRELLRKKYPDLTQRLSQQLLKFYAEVRQLCSEENYRCQYSIRNIHYFVLRYRKTHDALRAMRSSFLDGILMTDGPDAKAACSKLALTIFGKLP